MQMNKTNDYGLSHFKYDNESILANKLRIFTMAKRCTHVAQFAIYFVQSISVNTLEILLIL